MADVWMIVAEMALAACSSFEIVLCSLGPLGRRLQVRWVVVVVSLLELGLHRGSVFSLDGAATGLVLSWVGVVVVTLSLSFSLSLSLSSCLIQNVRDIILKKKLDKLFHP
jgi:hypothetical protein